MTFRQEVTDPLSTVKSRDESRRRCIRPRRLGNESQAALGPPDDVARSAAATAPAWRRDRSSPRPSPNIRQESDGPIHSPRCVECTGPLAYTYYSPDPLTLVVDIPEVDASQVPARINVGTKEVESVRVTSMARGRRPQTLARLEVKLASLVPYQIFSRTTSLNLVFERPAAAAGGQPGARVRPRRRPAGCRAGRAPPGGHSPGARSPRRRAARGAGQGRRTRPPSRRLQRRLPVRGVTATSRILRVVQTEESAASWPSRSSADGSLRYQDFFLGNPDRLVVDFADVSAAPPVRNAGGQPGARCARCASRSSAQLAQGRPPGRWTCQLARPIASSRALTA